MHLPLNKQKSFLINAIFFIVRDLLWTNGIKQCLMCLNYRKFVAILMVYVLFYMYPVSNSDQLQNIVLVLATKRPI